MTATLPADSAALVDTLARLEALQPADGAAPKVVLFPWMIPTILSQPGVILESLGLMLANPLSRHDIERAHRVLEYREHDVAGRIEAALQGRDRSDRAGNADVVSQIMIALGATAAAAALVGLISAAIFAALGAAILAVVAVVLGFFVMLLAVVVMVIIGLVKALLGGALAARGDLTVTPPA